jgi:hypothetical protein
MNVAIFNSSPSDLGLDCAITRKNIEMVCSVELCHTHGTLNLVGIGVVGHALSPITSAEQRIPMASHRNITTGNTSSIRKRVAWISTCSDQSLWTEQTQWADPSQRSRSNSHFTASSPAVPSACIAELLIILNCLFIPGFSFLGPVTALLPRSDIPKIKQGNCCFILALNIHVALPVIY